MNAEYEMTDEKYKLLYKKYLQSDPRVLLEMGGMKEGYRVLDLCAGPSARASQVAIEMGASYVASVDLNPFILKIQGKRWTGAKVESFCEDVFGYLEYTHIPKNEKFDLVICQQGVHFWLKPEVASKVFGVMNGGAAFVFDISNKKPSESPVIERYKIEGDEYVEVDWMVREDAYHVQIVSSSEPHFTKFRWLEPKTVKNICQSGNFTVNVKTEKDTDIYVCKREIDTRRA